MTAYRADPNDRGTLQGLGSALRASGDAAGAGPYLEAARKYDEITPLISRASTNAGRLEPAICAKLGSACEAAGRLREALAWFQIAIERDPLDREAQAALARLRRAIAGHVAPGPES